MKAVKVVLEPEDLLVKFAMVHGRCKRCAAMSPLPARHEIHLFALWERESRPNEVAMLAVLARMKQHLANWRFLARSRVGLQQT